MRNVLLAERREDDPDALPPSNADVSRRVSAQWVRMTEEEKGPYLEVAKREMERYQAAKEEQERKKKGLIGRGKREDEEWEKEEEDGGRSWERRMLMVPADQTAFLERLEWEESLDD